LGAEKEIYRKNMCNTLRINVKKGLTGSELAANNSGLG